MTPETAAAILPWALGVWIATSAGLAVAEVRHLLAERRERREAAKASDELDRLVADSWRRHLRHPGVDAAAVIATFASAGTPLPAEVVAEVREVGRW